MKLRELIPDATFDGAAGDADVRGLSDDSRNVKPGFVFFAVPGVKADGLGYAPQAIANGAIAVVTTSPNTNGFPSARVDDVRTALSKAAANFFARQPRTITAITGTSGKTSVASFTRQIWASLGHAAAALGTTGLVTPGGATYGSLTTPDPVTLHETLDRLAGEGVTHLAMEASSHGLDQRRLDGVRLAAGGFTNLSRDHLDYHPTMEDYLAAKLRLFDTLLQPGQPAVIDADSDVADKVSAACGAHGLKVMTVGRKGAFIRLLAAEAAPASTALTLECEGRRHDVSLPLAGDFMASNALVAAGLAIATGGEPARVFAALEHQQGAPGRLEKVGDRNGAPIFVDYAHKPDALEKVLIALRPIASKRLIVVFGCGGDRDAGKRPIMGEIAARLADIVIVTDDNPRSEEAAAIRKAVLASAPNALEIGDRRAAIRQAISMLSAGDALVIAGKGHETGQIVGSTVLPFSDHEAAREALRGLAA